MESLYRGRGLLLATLNANEGARVLYVEGKKWAKIASSSKSKPVHYHNFVSIAVPDVAGDSEDEADIGRFLYELSRLDSGLVGLLDVTRKLLHLMIDWAFEDAHRNKLSWESFRQVLDLDGPES